MNAEDWKRGRHEEKQFEGGAYYGTEEWLSNNGLKKNIDSHIHQGGDVGVRVSYSISDTWVPPRYDKRTVETIYAQVKNNLLWKKDDKKKEGESTFDSIFLPADAELVENTERGYALYRLPADDVRKRIEDDFINEYGYFYDEPFKLLALADPNKKIDIIFVSKDPAKSMLEIRERIAAGIKAPRKETGFKDGFIPLKVPVVYDTHAAWLIIAIGEMAEELSRTKMEGATGTHHFVQVITEALKLFYGKRNTDMAFDCSLFRYLDIRTGHDGKVYIDLPAKYMDKKLKNALSIVDVKTSDEMPLFRGEGSLIDHIGSLFGEKNISDEAVIKKLREVLCRIMGPINIWMAPRDDRKLLELSSNYGPRHGIPASAVLLCHELNNKKNYELSVADTHPEAERLFPRFQSVVKARIDALLQLSPSKGTANIHADKSLEFVLKIVNITDRYGAPLNPQLQKEAEEGLDFIKKQMGEKYQIRIE